MAMKVYINGDVVELDKSGDPLLNIPRNKAIYRIENNDITIFNNDDRTIFRTDTITNIQNQAGASIGNLQDVVKYLNKYWNISSMEYLGRGKGIVIRCDFTDNE